MAMGSQEWASPIAAAKRPTDEQLIEVTRHIIDEAIARGPAGGRRARRAGDAGRSAEDALHVFCYAPRKALIARTMQREGVGVEEATRLVDNTNKERDQWVRLHWERDWRAHENYDLSVNTERLGIDGSAELIVAAAKSRFSALTNRESLSGVGRPDSRLSNKPAILDLQHARDQLGRCPTGEAWSDYPACSASVTTRLPQSW